MYAFFGHEVKAVAPKGGANSENIQPNNNAANGKDVAQGESKPNGGETAWKWDELKIETPDLLYFNQDLIIFNSNLFIILT